MRTNARLYKFAPGTVRVATGDGVFLKNSRSSFMLPGAISVELIRRIGPLLEAGFDLDAEAEHLPPRVLQQLTAILDALLARKLVMTLPVVPVSVVYGRRIGLLAPEVLQVGLYEALLSQGYHVTTIGSHIDYLANVHSFECLVVVLDSLAPELGDIIFEFGQRSKCALVLGIVQHNMLVCVTGATAINASVILHRLAVSVASDCRGNRSQSDDAVSHGEGLWWLNSLLASGVATVLDSLQVDATWMTILNPTKRTTERYYVSPDPRVVGKRRREPVDAAVSALLALADAGRCVSLVGDAFMEVVSAAPPRVDLRFGPLMELGEANLLQLPLCRSVARFGAGDIVGIASDVSYLDSRGQALRNAAARYAAAQTILSNSANGTGNKIRYVVRLPDMSIQLVTLACDLPLVALGCGASHLEALVEGMVAVTAQEVSIKLAQFSEDLELFAVPVLPSDPALLRLYAIARRYNPSVVVSAVPNRLSIATAVVSTDVGLISVHAGKTLAEAARRALLGFIQFHMSRSAAEPADSDVHIHQLPGPLCIAEGYIPRFIEATPAELMRRLVATRMHVGYEPFIPIHGLGRDLISACVTVIP